MTIEPSKLLNIQENAVKHREQLDKLRREGAAARLYAPHPAPHGVAPDDLAGLHDFAAQKIGDVPLLLEFGVCGGKSMRQMIQRFTHPESRFVGFDSFEGLPEAWKEMPRGAFSMKGKRPNIADPRVSFVQGWFQDTLPGYLTSFKPPETVLVHYDADLYSATLFVLCSLWHPLREYYFIFDEFMSEEIIALDDFSRGYPVDMEFYCQTNKGGFPPLVFGKLTRRTAAEVPARTSG